jgi:hypothetical protein
MSEEIDEELLKILACPACKGGILYDKDSERLICQRCKRRYSIKDGIPIMLVEEAEIGEQVA